MAVLGSHSSGLKRTLAIPKGLKHTTEVWPLEAPGWNFLSCHSLSVILLCGARYSWATEHTRAHKRKCDYCAGAAQKRLVQGFMLLLGRGKLVRRAWPHSELGDVILCVSALQQELSGSYGNCYTGMSDTGQGFMSAPAHLAQITSLSQKLPFP